MFRSRTGAIVIIAGALSGLPACLLDGSAYETGASNAGGTGPASAGAGGAESTGGAQSTGTGTTAPAPCDSQDDCPDDVACTVDVCDAGVCKHFLKTSQVYDEVPTDCLQIDCDADGNGTVVADMDDVPDDGNPCTTETCNGKSIDVVVLVGDVDVGECGRVSCVNGMPGDVMNIRSKCWDLDVNQADCMAPECVDSMCTDTQTMAPAGWSCQVPGESWANCDGSNTTCPD